MPFIEYRYRSDVLGKQSCAWIITPQVPHHEIRRYRVMYLLHGLSDDYSIWARQTSIERYLADTPYVVVMPDGGRGFYCDAEQGPAYETALAVELRDHILRTFPVTDNGWCVTGLSMGGYGAVRFALRYPKQFTSAVSHSGALHFGHQTQYRNAETAARMGMDIESWARLHAELSRICGDSPTGSDYDLYHLASQINPAERPKLWLDCGVDDFLIEVNREYSRHLDAIGYNHTFREFAGEHNWSYWDAHVQQAIEFHRKSD